MSKKVNIAVIIISVIAICISSVSLYFTLSPAEEEKGDIQYVMYLGTNDKDTNEPVCTPAEAKEKVEAILCDKMGGFTIQEANGGWLGDDGTQYNEYTLVIYLSATDIDAVHSVADIMIEEFNQSSILIQANTTQTEFYTTAE